MSEQEPDVWQDERDKMNKKYKGMGEEQIIIRLLEGLDKGTKKLNCLTLVLLFLTVVLAVLAGIQIFGGCI